MPQSNFHPLVIYFPGQCALSNNWTIHSMVTRTMFPPARHAPTWPRSWRSTPRPALTSALLRGVTTKCTGNGPSHPKCMDRETPPPKDMMVLFYPRCFFQLISHMSSFDTLSVGVHSRHLFERNYSTFCHEAVCLRLLIYSIPC